jgi:hypothetical protein
MKQTRRTLSVGFAAVAILTVAGQAQTPRSERRPPAVARPAAAKSQPTDWDGSVFVLDGLPMVLNLHHDTVAGTNEPVDVYDLAIEMQMMNSDHNPEPVGLIIHNFFSAHPLDRKNDINPRNARDCGVWVGRIQKALENHDPKSRTWPYLEFLTNTNARMLQTNEDGQVWYSDDIQCWGALDRFPPF